MKSLEKIKILTTLVTLFIFSGNLFAQWSGNCPETTNCDVGIATSTPQGYLHVSPSYSGGFYPMLRPLILADYNWFGTQITTFTATNNGRVGIGTANPAQSCHVVGTTLLQGNTEIRGNTIIQGDLTVNNGSLNQFRVTSSGLVVARQIDVHLDPIPDYVFHAAFNKDSSELYSKTGKYKKLSLFEIEDYVKKHYHLPGIKSASEYNNIGKINLGELNLKLLEKIEELTLHTISQQREIDNLMERLEKIESNTLNSNQTSIKSQTPYGLLIGTIVIFVIMIFTRKISKLTKKNIQ